MSMSLIISKFLRRNIHKLMMAAILFSPIFIEPSVQAAPLPKDWCGRIWGLDNTNSRIIWDNPITGASNTAAPLNVGTIPPIPAASGINGYAALGIHARSGTLYVLDRDNSALKQYSMATVPTATTWTSTPLTNVPSLANGANFNKMTVVGDILIIARTDSLQVARFNLDPATGAVLNPTASPVAYTFNNDTPLNVAKTTFGNPADGTTGIGGGDIAQDEYGDTYMLTYDNSSNPYAYVYKQTGTRTAPGTQWLFRGRIKKDTNANQFAGFAIYNDTLYVKGNTPATAAILFSQQLTRSGSEYAWPTNDPTFGTVGTGIAITDLASCGVPAIGVTKTQSIHTDAAGTPVTQTPDQTRIATGQYIKYTITGTNGGDAWARNAYMTDDLPPGVEYVANTATENGVNLNAPTYPFGTSSNKAATSTGSPTGEIRLPFLGNSNVTTYTFVVKVTGTAPTVSNQAFIGYSNPYPSDPPNCSTGLNCGTTALETLYPSIFGTVWKDTNGSANNTFTNIFTTGEVGTNTNPLATDTTKPLYALLLDSTGKVILSQPVANDGTYAFQAINTNQTGLKIQLSTTTFAVGTTPTAASIPTNWKATSPKITAPINVATADISNQDFGISLPAGMILVKRITAINGQTTNPNDGTDLSTIINSATTTNDDPTRKWPAGYLKGQVNAGQIRPSDTIEYTIYYLNDGSADAKTLKICDPIKGKQVYVSGSMKLTPGGAGTAISLTDGINTAIDRANNYSTGAAPTDCNASSSTATGMDRGGVAIQLNGTGASNQPDLTTIPAATTTGTPTTSYGSFKFTTKVDP
jgi:uncharacterized repeat protein (TIGR01451 family)